MKLRKRRKFTNHKKEVIYFSLFFLLLFISVGYAYLSRTLSITGQTELSANTWDIHFANLSVKEGSVTASTPAAIQTNTTSINYSVLLDKPGDYYEFEVDIVNAGTLGGKLSLVNIQGISSAAEPYLESSIKYTNGNPVQVDDLLNPGASKRIVVRVGYKEDLNSLPDSNLILDLVFNANYSQTNEEEPTVETIIQQLKTENSSCFDYYFGQVTDQVGQTVTAKNIYFDNCIDKRNVIFNNMCWQMIRTTQTGGIKMIYNGEPDQNGECGSSRGRHKGISQLNSGTRIINSSYLYGSSFTYDISTNKFSLVDTTTATWSDSTYENLLGKFTCMNTDDTCSVIYQINAYSSDTSAYLSYYKIDSTNRSLIGSSSFNANFESPAMVGYMFNKVYNYKINSISGTNKFGSTFTYENGTYTLSGTTQDLTTLSGSDIANTHYTCWNDTGTCTNISYVYYINSTNGYYIEISNGKSVIDAINEMLYEDNVNKYNSSVKGIIDAWFAQNLSSKTNMLEDTVYCNARNMINQSTNGWNPEGGTAKGSTSYLRFKNYNVTINLACPNETDQFSVSNNKAKLTYPVSLINHEEWSRVGSTALREIGTSYLDLAPYSFNFDKAYSKIVFTDGSMSSYSIDTSMGIRPAVSLKSSVVISSGDGSEESPWVVE